MPRSILDTHPHIAAQFHPEKNGDMLASALTFGSKKKVWWLCPNTSCVHKCPHEWEAPVQNRCAKTKPSGCPHCGINGKAHCIHRTIAHTHPKIAAELHPKKNGEVTAESIPSYSNQELWFLCPEIAAQWHPRKNGTLTPSEFSYGSNVDIWWLCPIKCEYGCLHEWQARIVTRCKLECGCPYCAPTHKKVCIHNSIVTTEPQVAAEWDYVKNVGLDPTTIPRSSEIEAYFLCPLGHSYCATVGNRCRGGTGCSKCRHKTQKFLYEFLKSHYPDTENEFRLEATGLRRFDFWIPSLHTIIELDGAQHFFQVANWQSADETRTIDIDKTRAALAAGFNVIRISQQDVYASSFRGDSSWTTESMLAAINSVSEMRVQYISRDPELYRAHVDALALQYHIL